MGTIEAELFGNGTRCRHLLEHTLPDTTGGPTVIAIVDRGGGTILRRTVSPAAPRFEYMKNAADHTTVIHARLAGLSVGQMRLKRRPGFV